MRYFRYRTDDGPALIVERDGERRDISAAAPGIRRFGDLARAAAVSGLSVDDIAERFLGDAPKVSDGTHNPAIPIQIDEVWAAGVTYEISEQAREGESDLPEVYLEVYHADRPELFLKATAGRTVGPGGAIGIRGDSNWNVPEPELGLVLHRGSLIGYTAGNDVSSRAIEGANPLYLPQAKIYDRACSIGPCIASLDAVDDPHALEMRMRIRRDGEVVYDGETSTAEMARSCDELVDWLGRHNRLPEFTVLLTGTSLVPEDSFTLEAGDVVAIEIEAIGTLVNEVTVV